MYFTFFWDLATLPFILYSGWYRKHANALFSKILIHLMNTLFQRLLVLNNGSSIMLDLRLVFGGILVVLST